MNPNFVVIPNRLWVDIRTNKELPRHSDTAAPPAAPGDWRPAQRGFVVYNKRAGTRTSLGEYPTHAQAQDAADSMNGVRPGRR